MLLSSPCLCNHIFHLTIIDARLQSVLQESCFQLGSTLIYLLACLEFSSFPALLFVLGFIGENEQGIEIQYNFSLLNSSLKAITHFSKSSCWHKVGSHFPSNLIPFTNSTFTCGAYQSTTHQSSQPLPVGKAALTPFLPSPSQGCSPCPTPFPHALGHQTLLVFVVMAFSSLSQAWLQVGSMCCRQGGVFWACVGKVSKGSPSHHRRLGTACSRKGKPGSCKAWSTNPLYVHLQYWIYCTFIGHLLK